jgi:putative membrane protein
MRKNCRWIGLMLTVSAFGQIPQPIGPPIAPPTNISTGSSVPHVDDKKFLHDATLDGMTEVALGKLAEEKASNPKVKQFAERMVEEYTASNRALVRVASDETIVVPKAIDAKHQQRVDRLAKLSGEEFDRAYIQDETKQRHQDLKEFTNASQGGHDPNLKSFATTTLASIEDHLNALKILSKAVK